VRALKARFAGVLEERTRLAREIHDTLLQGVTGIALQLRGVLPHVHRSPDHTADALARIVDLAEKTSREARQAVWDMRPLALGSGDFVRALDVAVQRLAAETLDARVSATGRAHAAELRSEHEAVVLRVVQEAVANVVRHARARTVRVRLAYRERHVRVVIIDDGCGFPVHSDFRTYTGHWGLLGMQERAESVGGKLSVRSAPNEGTRVTLLVPYARYAAALTTDGMVKEKRLPAPS
jgi:signal transduction histidine kinase